eukprot:9435204-Pyramimonas_sp.AAC.1
MEKSLGWKLKSSPDSDNGMRVTRPACLVWAVWNSPWARACPRGLLAWELRTLRARVRACV